MTNRTNAEKCADRKRERLESRQRRRARQLREAVRKSRAVVRTPMAWRWMHQGNPTIEFCPSPDFTRATRPLVQYQRRGSLGWYAIEPSGRVCCRPKVKSRKVYGEPRRERRGWRTRVLAVQAMMAVDWHRPEWLMPAGRWPYTSTPARYTRCLAFPLVLLPHTHDEILP